MAIIVCQKLQKYLRAGLRKFDTIEVNFAKVLDAYLLFQYV